MPKKAYNISMCTHIQFQNHRNPNKFSFFSRQKILEIKSNGKMEISLLLLITALSLSLYEVQFCCCWWWYFFLSSSPTMIGDLFSIEQRRSMQNRSHHRWKKKYWKVRWVENWCEGLRWFFVCREAICGTEKRLCLMKIPSNLFSLERTHIVHHCEIDYNETRLNDDDIYFFVG